MGKKWDYDVPSVEIWAECLRVLKPGGHLLAFAGTRTQHRMAVRIEDAGFEIRDMIAWVYGSGFPKSLDVSKAIDKAAGVDRGTTPDFRNGPNTKPTKGDKYSGGYDGQENIDGGPATAAAQQWQGWGTALKPALEPITVARKPLAGTVAENVLAHGTGGLNIDGCRVDGAPPSVPQPVFKSPTGRIYGMKTGEGRNGEMSQATGRWPANLIHDGSDEVVGLFPETGASKASMRGEKTSAGTHTGWARESHKGFDSVRGHNDNGGSAARFFYCAKASKRDRDEGLEGFALCKVETMNSYSVPSEGRTADKNGGPRANIHPTVKPTDLMRYLCRLVTPHGGVVLDPFMGSGSTGKAAMIEGFQFIGCEMSPEYFEIAKARIDAVIPKDLFA
jgi:site-specific DNA-methyltransferase (adenine-specific)